MPVSIKFASVMMNTQGHITKSAKALQNSSNKIRADSIKNSIRNLQHVNADMNLKYVEKVLQVQVLGLPLEMKEL